MKRTTLKNATLTMRQAISELLHPSPTNKELAAALKHFGENCAYCGTPIGDTRGNLDWDHLMPVAHDGSNSIHNRVPACTECNRAKGNTSWVEFLRIKLGTGSPKARCSADIEARQRKIQEWVDDNPPKHRQTHHDAQQVTEALYEQVRQFEETFQKLRDCLRR